MYVCMYVCMLLHVLYAGVPKWHAFLKRIAPVCNWHDNTQLPGYKEFHLPKYTTLSSFIPIRLFSPNFDFSSFFLPQNRDGK